MRLTLIFVFLSALLMEPRAQNVSYTNPVFDHDFPDPNLVKAGEFYYGYSTQADWKKDGKGGPYVIPILRSRDLVNWEFVGDALKQKPTWKPKGGIWAPDACYFNNQYYLYYSFSTWGDPNPGIGVATSKKPQGPFTDHGKLFFSREIGVDNSIDAFFYAEKGRNYLVWGSFHGIYAVELSKDGLKVKGKKLKLAGSAYEGSYLMKRNGYYYYFGSTGNCCEGASSTYKVKVSRSKNLKGPYLDREGKPALKNGGTLILEGNREEAGFVGPGHNGDIVEDKNGDSWMVYHAYDKRQPTKRVMLLDKIIWQDGWPTIEGKRPSIAPTTAPDFVGKAK